MVARSGARPRRYRAAYSARYYRSHLEGIRANEKAQRTRRLLYLTEYKAAHPCTDCGEADPIVLEFDHLPQFPKLGNIAALLNSRAKLLAELAKCEVVCANCHARRTYERKVKR